MRSSMLPVALFLVLSSAACGQRSFNGQPQDQKEIADIFETARLRYNDANEVQGRQIYLERGRLLCDYIGHPLDQSGQYGFTGWIGYVKKVKLSSTNDVNLEISVSPIIVLSEFDLGSSGFRGKLLNIKEGDKIRFSGLMQLSDDTCFDVYSFSSIQSRIRSPQLYVNITSFLD